MLSTVWIVVIISSVIIGVSVFTGVWFGLDLGSKSSSPDLINTTKGPKTISSSSSSTSTAEPFTPGPVPSPPAPSGFKYVVYLDQANNDLAYSWSGQPHAFDPYLAKIAASGYTIAIMAFYLPGNSGSKPNTVPGSAHDAAQAWNRSLPVTKPPGLKILLSVGGSDFFPDASNMNFANAFGIEVGAYAATNSFDGLDFDIENFGTYFGNPWTADVVPWLIMLTNSARASYISTSNGRMPIITHAPQGPYFSHAFVPNNFQTYADFSQLIGDNVSWYNVQFYNQGPGNQNDGVCTDLNTNQAIPCCYSTAMSLATSSQSACPSFAWGSSVTEIINLGVPFQKVIVGKPIRSIDGGGGQVPGGINPLLGTLNYGGIMGWEWDGTSSTACSALFGAPCT